MFDWYSVLQNELKYAAVDGAPRSSVTEASFEYVMQGFKTLLLPGNSYIHTPGDWSIMLEAGRPWGVRGGDSCFKISGLEHEIQVELWCRGMYPPIRMTYDLRYWVGPLPWADWNQRLTRIYGGR